jgi:hypothetical protein
MFVATTLLSWTLNMEFVQSPPATHVCFRRLSLPVVIGTYFDVFSFKDSNDKFTSMISWLVCNANVCAVCTYTCKSMW